MPDSTDHKNHVIDQTANASEMSERKRMTSDHSVLSIWLDSYNDIFSDFDSRPFSGRALSDDFINETKKISKEKTTGAISLKLLIPENLRLETTEQTIIKNLHGYFQKISTQLKDDLKQTRIKGLFFSLLGLILMVAANYIVNQEQKTFAINAIRIVLEPAGWYFVWTGLDTLFSTSRHQKQEHDFYNRMANSEIVFYSI